MKLPDWMTRIAVMHKAAYKEEEININSLAGINSQQASNAYQQAINIGSQTSLNQNYYGYLTANQGTALGSQARTGSYITVSSTNSWNGISTYVAGSGSIATVQFTDAHGQLHWLNVDQVYYQTLMAISQAHQSPLRNNQSPTPAPMLEGDFSFDEMDKAEDLIKEIEGARHVSSP